MAKTISELAQFVDARIVGDGEIEVHGVASLESAAPGEIAYLDDEKFLEAATRSRASCVIVRADSEPNLPCQLRVKNPKLAFSLIAELLHPAKQRPPEIHSSAVIADTADVALQVFVGAFVCIGENSHVGSGTQIRAGVKIGDNVTIGTDCVIHPNVFIEDGMSIGDRVILHAGVVVGADGFGYVRGDMGYHKFPQIGTVVIEDDVEIGANSTVDRPAVGETRIRKGTKIDNLVHVAHGVAIGRRVLLAAQVGIAGSTTIGDDVMMAGQSGVAGHITVGDKAIVGAKSAVLQAVEAGAFVTGSPAFPHADWRKASVVFRHLPSMKKRLEELEQRLVELEEKLAACQPDQDR